MKSQCKMKLSRLIMIALGATTLSMMVLVMKMATLTNDSRPSVSQSGIRVDGARGEPQVFAGVDPGDIPAPPTYDKAGRAVLPSRLASGDWKAAASQILNANKPLLAAAGSRPNRITLVSAIWDIGRGSMKTSDKWDVLRRPFSHYLSGVKEFLAYAFPKVLFTDLATFTHLQPMIEAAVEAGAGPTTVVIKSLEELQAEFQPFALVDAVTHSGEWLDQSAWIQDSPQAQLPMYIPRVMSKLRFTRDAARWNPFNTDGFLWMDGAFTARCLAAVSHCAACALSSCVLVYLCTRVAARLQPPTSVTTPSTSP